MVFYFTSTRHGESNLIYMGRDKHENEELIKFGWDEDVWFHTDKLSSAHVYLRMNPGQTWDSLPEALLEDLAQLTKHNSIQGSKLDNVTVIYTPWANLKKNASMDVGQVTFQKTKQVKRLNVPTKKNEILNPLNKTREEKSPDFDEERHSHHQLLRNSVKAEANKQRLATEIELDVKREQKRNWNYDKILKEEHMFSNVGGMDEDDFM